jgi:hypothetical protein
MMLRNLAEPSPAATAFEKVGKQFPWALFLMKLNLTGNQAHTPHVGD